MTATAPSYPAVRQGLVKNKCCRKFVARVNQCNKMMQILTMTLITNKFGAGL